MTERYTWIEFAITEDPSVQGKLNTIIKRELNRISPKAYTTRYTHKGNIELRTTSRRFTAWQLQWNPQGSPYLQYAVVRES
jgi:hypothetical protein